MPSDIETTLRLELDEIDQGLRDTREELRLANQRYGQLLEAKNRTLSSIMAVIIDGEVS